MTGAAPRPARAPRRGRAGAWHVYVVRTVQGTLYAGIALDVERRLREHEAGAPRGAKYLRGRGPLELVLARRVGPRALALRVERRIKRLPRARKEALVAGRSRFRALLREVRAELGERA